MVLRHLVSSKAMRRSKLDGNRTLRNSLPTHAPRPGGWYSDTLCSQRQCAGRNWTEIEHCEIHRPGTYQDLERGIKAPCTTRYGVLVLGLRKDQTQVQINKFNATTQDMGYIPEAEIIRVKWSSSCLLYTSPSPRDMRRSRMPSSA